MGTFSKNNWRDMVIKPRVLEADKVQELGKKEWDFFSEHPETIQSKVIVYAIIVDRKAIWVINYYDQNAMHEERISSSELEMLHRLSKLESVTNQLVTALI